MATAFITGATGFIGSHVALHLLQKGWRVRALKRPNSPAPCLERAAIEWYTGDIRHFEQVRSAMAGCETVFHIAADYRLWARNPEEIYETNVAGTVNVLRAALLHRVERVVYTSSVGALGLRADGRPANETTPVHLDDMIGHYKRSKFLAEREAERFHAQGLPVVMVHPSTPVGPGDHKPTPTGKIIVDYLNRRMPAYLDTGLNLIHVSRRCERSSAGSGTRSRRREIHPGKPEPYPGGNLCAPGKGFRNSRPSLSPAPPPDLFLGTIFQAISNITGREPLIPYEGVKMAQRFMFFDASKAVTNWGFPEPRFRAGS